MKLEAQWITGFVDAKGYFYVKINNDYRITKNYQILPEFCIVQHKKDTQVLHALKRYFNCGIIRKSYDNQVTYLVKNIEHLLQRIIPFFELHHLKTKKRIDFQKFRRIMLKIKQGIHLTNEGIEEIQSIVSQMSQLKQTKIESNAIGNNSD